MKYPDWDIKHIYPIGSSYIILQWHLLTVLCSISMRMRAIWRLYLGSRLILVVVWQWRIHVRIAYLYKHTLLCTKSGDSKIRLSDIGN